MTRAGKSGVSQSMAARVVCPKEISLGLLLGFLAAIGLAGLLVWLILRRANKEATASFLRGCALLLTYKKPPVALNGREERDTLGFQPNIKKEN